jgi:hypothetical protein
MTKLTKFFILNLPQVQIKQNRLNSNFCEQFIPLQNRKTSGVPMVTKFLLLIETNRPNGWKQLAKSGSVVNTRKKLVKNEKERQAL